jgi:hypothetical protein
VTTDADTGSAFNRFNYAQNNPYRYTDPDGRDTIEDETHLGRARGAEAELGGGWAGPPSRMTRTPADGVRNLAEARAQTAAKDSAKTGQTATKSEPKETGSYTNTHESGKTYDGKGSRERSQESGRRVEAETGDKHTATDWTPAKGSREAFKQESERLDSNGGSKSDSNHNKIESPGKKMREEDAKKK